MSTTHTHDLRKSVSSLLEEVTNTPKPSRKTIGSSTTPKTELKKSLSGVSDPNKPMTVRKQLTWESRQDSSSSVGSENYDKKFTLPRQNSSKSLLIAQAGGDVKLRKQLSRSSSSVGDGGSGASAVLHNFLDEVLVSSPKSALARQKSQHAPGAAK